MINMHSCSCHGATSWWRGVVTTRFGNLSRFETGTSHFATSRVLSWDAHLETHNTLHTDAHLAFTRMMHCYCITIYAHKHPLLFILIYIYFIRRTHTKREASHLKTQH